MKKLMLPLFVVSCISANAQLRDAMLKKAGEKLKGKNEKTTTNETNTNTNSSTTTPGNSNPENTTDPNAGNNSQNSNAQTNPYANNPFLSGGKKEIRPKYTFQSNVLMEMKSYDKKGNLEEKKITQMRWQISSEPYTAMEVTNPKDGKISTSINETDKSQMVMLVENDGQKVAMVRKIDPAKMSEQTKQEGDKKPTVTKTGRTKKVLGYNCEEWVSTDEKGNKTEMWVTNEIALDLSKTYSMYGSGDKDLSKRFGTSEYPQGFMMDMTHYDVSGEKFNMTTLEVNMKAEKVIETAGYMVY